MRKWQEIQEVLWKIIHADPWNILYPILYGDMGLYGKKRFNFSSFLDFYGDFLSGMPCYSDKLSGGNQKTLTGSVASLLFDVSCGRGTDFVGSRETAG